MRRSSKGSSWRSDRACGVGSFARSPESAGAVLRDNGVSMLSRVRIEGRARPPRVVNPYIRAPAPTCTYDGRRSRPIPTSPPVSVLCRRHVGSVRMLAHDRDVDDCPDFWSPPQRMSVIERARQVQGLAGRLAPHRGGRRFEGLVAGQIEHARTKRSALSSRASWLSSRT